MKGRVFTNDISIANDKLPKSIMVAKVLWCATKDGSFRDLVLPSQSRALLQDNVRGDSAAISNHHIALNYTERSDFNVLTYLSCRIDNRRRVNACPHVNHPCLYWGVICRKPSELAACGSVFNS